MSTAAPKRSVKWVSYSAICLLIVGSLLGLCKINDGMWFRLNLLLAGKPHWRVHLRPEDSIRPEALRHYFLAALITSGGETVGVSYKGLLTAYPEGAASSAPIQRRFDLAELWATRLVEAWFLPLLAAAGIEVCTLILAVVRLAAGEPNAAPNGGPAASSESSVATLEPPSVNS